MLLPTFPSFRPMGMVGEACLTSIVYYPRTPDYTLYSGVYICWSEHSDSSFVNGFMSLDYGLGTITTNILNSTCIFLQRNQLVERMSYWVNICSDDILKICLKFLFFEIQ